MATMAKKTVKGSTTKAAAPKKKVPEKTVPKATTKSPANTGTGTIEKQIADFIKLIPDATMVIDLKGKVMAWNHAMEELTGVRAKEIIGKGDYEYSLPFYGERRPVLADIALKEVGDLRKKYKSITPWGNTLVAEARVTNLPGGPATVYGSATILKNSRGKVLGVLELVCEVRK
jgi:PAS domain S-box-containing protein